MDELIAASFGTGASTKATDAHAWLTALCETETALARAAARVGLIAADEAATIERVFAQLADSDPADIGAEAVAGGNPVIPLVARARAAVAARGGDASTVHLGATSQDIIDTATMLVVRRALDGVLVDLGVSADAAARLAYEHRDLAMIGRTLLQRAQPTTFGALAAVWGSGLDRAGSRLTSIRATLPVQYGGAAGTLAAVAPHGFELLAALAHELGLAEPDGVWHVERGVIAELAGALGQTAVAVAKPALDVVLLAQPELGELAEAAPGGSSAMPHKQNPIAAATARAAAAQAPGLVATLLSAVSELQRGAGPWHAEWPALTGLLRSVGGAANRLGACLTGLRVDAAAMRRNLDDAGLGTDVGHAPDLVDRYLGRRQR